jgi:polar amino acid transport system substrate-binding protein
MQLCLLMFTVLFFSPHVAFAKPKSFYYGIANEISFPFVEVDSSQGRPSVSGGILKQLAEALMKELHLKTEFVLLPQQRVGPDLVSGDLSLACFVHESWFAKEYIKKLLWSDELATNTNLIATVKGKPVNKIEDLYGKQVGTIVNYYYEKLDPFFERGSITRDAGTNTSGNIQKLLHGHMDYMVISNMEFDYFKKKYPELRAYDLGLDTVKVKCVLSKKAGIKLEDLNKAIATLKKNGTLEKILRP